MWAAYKQVAQITLGAPKNDPWVTRHIDEGGRQSTPHSSSVDGFRLRETKNGTAKSRQPLTKQVKARRDG